MNENNSLYSRTEIILGKEKIDKLKNATVIICGLGGVGGYVAESIVRIGVGRVIFIDSDTTDETNLNRQILATQQTIGVPKVVSATERAKSINKDGEFLWEKTFLTPENIPLILEKYNPDCVADAIDNVTAKISLITECQKRGIDIICSMGTGNKTDPQRFKVADIYKTSGCPLARAMRTLLKKRGIKKLKVVYSDEPPIKSSDVIGTLSFVPAVAGHILAYEIVNSILNKE